MNNLDYEKLRSVKKNVFSQDKNKSLLGLKQLEELASYKNKYALYELGLIYINGQIVEKNIQKGINLLIYSGDLGYERAYYELGNVYLTKGDYQSARKYYLRCSRDANAFYMLGELYSSGMGCQMSKHKAFNYYMQASKQGSSEADYMIGNAYYFGIGTKIDRQKAIYYLNKANRKKIFDRYKIYQYI